MQTIVTEVLAFARGKNGVTTILVGLRQNQTYYYEPTDEIAKESF